MVEHQFVGGLYGQGEGETQQVTILRGTTKTGLQQVEFPGDGLSLAELIPGLPQLGFPQSSLSKDAQSLSVSLP